MTTAQYVKKYNLRESDRFSHPEFISDFTLDFISLVEWFKSKSAWQYPHFQECIKQIRQKWDSINNKTAGELPESLWGYFYATVVVKAEEELFPDIVELRHSIYCMNDDELEQFLRERGIYPSFRFQSEDIERTISASKSPVLRYAYNLYCNRKQERDDRERQREQQKYARWKEAFRERERQRYDWFNSFIGGLIINSAPTQEFKMLGLQDSASEDEVKSSYRTLSMKHHPDRGGKQEIFIAITEAKNKCLAYISKNVKV